MKRESCDVRPDRDECVRIRGARVHNLQNLDLDLPRDRLVVITGPSGSGKSSLAFDTLYAEGQRQYIESLSVYARQFLHQLERPDVDLIEGLQPTISIDQRAGSHNPRSTVATVTEIYDYLRLLYARLGEPHCYQCGTPIRQQSPEQILDDAARPCRGHADGPAGPAGPRPQGAAQEVFEAIRKAGFLRARVDGEVVDVERPAGAGAAEGAPHRGGDRPGGHPRRGPAAAGRVDPAGASSTATGWCWPATSSGPRPAGSVWHDKLFSTQYACPNCKISYEELEPRTFSFNSPYGACPACEGLGARVGFDPELVAAGPRLVAGRGAVAPWKGGRAGRACGKYRELLAAWSEAAGDGWTTPLDELKPKALRAAPARRRQASSPALLASWRRSTPRPPARRSGSGWRRFAARSSARSARARGCGRRPARCALGGPGDPRGDGPERGRGPPLLPRTWPSRTTAGPIAQPHRWSEISARLEFLDKVGLEYLTLDRSAETLSGGELQRVRLASGLGSGLVGVCYVLDEPSIGLHPRDNDRLIEALRRAQVRGNTVVVVEHDETIMRRADWLVDLGPGAGRHGGRIVAQGTPAEVAADASSLTGRYLAGRERIPLPARAAASPPAARSRIEGVTTNNLKNVTVRVPALGPGVRDGRERLGQELAVERDAGPRAWSRRLGGMAPKPGPHTSLRGASQIDKVVEVDQSPIGRTPRSNPATYTGVFDEIRKVFADTRDARARGYKRRPLQLQHQGRPLRGVPGAGPAADRDELPARPLRPLPGVRGQTLQPPDAGDPLPRPVDRRRAGHARGRGGRVLRELPRHRPAARQACRKSGWATSRSASPRSRSPAARPSGSSWPPSWAASTPARRFYILDEPTTGLHFDDIKKLLAVLGRLVDLGNTVVVIEHNLDVIKSADWIIDLGPEGGDGGGRVVATGTPEQVAAMEDNATGQFLRGVLGG